MSGAGNPRVPDAPGAGTELPGTEPEAAFDDLAALAARLLHAPYAFITLVDDTCSVRKARIGVLPDDPVQRAVEESFCRHVGTSGEPLVAGDVTALPPGRGDPAVRSLGVRAWAGFPLLSAEGAALGAFCVVDTVTREWTEDDMTVLRVLSAAAGRELALRTAVRDTALAHRRLALLEAVGQALAETLDAEEAVARLARLVVPVLGDWSLVSLVSLADEAGTLTDVGWWHARDDCRPALDKLAVERLVGLRGRGGTIQAQQRDEPVVLQSGALEAGLSILVSPQARDAYTALDPGAYGCGRWPSAAPCTACWSSPATPAGRRSARPRSSWPPTSPSGPAPSWTTPGCTRGSRPPRPRWSRRASSCGRPPCTTGWWPGPCRRRC